MQNQFHLYIKLSTQLFFLLGVVYSCNSPEKTNFDCTKNTGIPVLNITIDSLESAINKTNYFAGQLIQKDSQACESNQLQVSIKGRGNTSWSFPKRSYQIKLENEQNLLGLPSAEKFVLLANYSDKSLLRNRLAFRLSEISSIDWTPASKSVALYINNNYLGIYLLTQKIEAREKAIKDSETVLLEIDHIERLHQGDIYFETDYNLFCVKSTLQDSLTDILKIKNKINQAESAVMDSSSKTNYEQHFDEDALIDWYIINEIAKNNDALFNSSVYMHFSIGEKLQMGPVWDYDIAFGNINYNGNDSIQGFFIKKAHYFSELFKDDTFKNKVKKRYSYFYNQKTKLLNSIDSWSLEITKETDKNFRKWPILDKYIWPNAKVLGSHKAEVNYLKEWLSERMDWLNKAYSKL